MIDDTVLLRGVRNLFPADSATWCQVRVVDHAARAMLSRVLVDLGPGRALHAQADAFNDGLIGQYLKQVGGLDLQPAEAEAVAEAIRLRRGEAPELARDRVLTNLMIAFSSRPAFATLSLRAAQADALFQQRLHEAYLAETAFEDQETNVGQGVLAPVVTAEQILHGLREAGTDTRDLSITGITPVLGGFSRQTLICDLVGSDLPGGKLVVRAEMGADYSGAAIREEYATADALFRSGVKVPRPIGLSSAGGTVKPFMLMEFADGAAMEYTPTVSNAALCREAGYQLGRIHKAQVEHFPHVAGAALSNVEQTLLDLDALEEKCRATRGSNAVVAYAMNWLRTHVERAAGPRSLTHGDYRGHNMLHKDGQLTAILDWEHGRISHPARDFGYSRSFIDAIGGWDIFVQAYIEAGSIVPDPEAVRYFEILASVFIITVLAQIGNGYSGSPTQQLATAASVVHRGPIQMKRLIDLLELA